MAIASVGLAPLMESPFDDPLGVPVPVFGPDPFDLNFRCGPSGIFQGDALLPYGILLLRILAAFSLRS